MSIDEKCAFMNDGIKIEKMNMDRSEGNGSYVYNCVADLNGQKVKFILKTNQQVDPCKFGGAEFSSSYGEGYAGFGSSLNIKDDDIVLEEFNKEHHTKILKRLRNCCESQQKIIQLYKYLQNY